MKIPGKTLADRVKYARGQRDLTQQELADAAKIPMRTLQDIEYGKIEETSFGYGLGLAKALQVLPEELAGKAPVEMRNVTEPQSISPETFDAIKAAARQGVFEAGASTPEEFKLLEAYRKRAPLAKLTVTAILTKDPADLKAAREEFGRVARGNPKFSAGQKAFDALLQTVASQ